MAQPAVGSSRGRFSFGKGLAHALLAASALVGIGALAVAGGLFPLPAFTWPVTALFAGLLFAGIFLASFLLQTERRGCGGVILACAGLFGLGAAGLLLGGTWLVHLHPAAITDDDKDFPDLAWTPDGQRYRHAALGFSMPAPPGRFVEAPELAEQLRAGGLIPQTWAWAYEDTVSHERILVLLSKGVGDTRDDFEGFTEGFRRSYAGHDGVELRRNEVRWGDEGGDYLLQSLLDGSIYVDARCLASGPRQPVSYVVCVTIVARTEGWARRFLIGFEREDGAG